MAKQKSINNNIKKTGIKTKASAFPEFSVKVLIWTQNMVAKEINLNNKSFNVKQCFLGFRKDTFQKFGLTLNMPLFLN